MFNVTVNMPEDITEMMERLINFQTDKLLKEYTAKEAEAVIDYLEKKNTENILD